MCRLARLFIGALFLYTFLCGILLRSSFSVPSLSASQVSDPTECGISLSIHAGQMSAALTGETMKSIMEAIARQTGISVFVEKSLLDLPRTVHFKDLPLEAGLKKVIGRESYAMVFSAGVDPLGNHPVKAIRVYPRGKTETGPYVRIRPFHASHSTDTGTGHVVEFTPEEVDRILSRNDAIYRSVVARRIEAGKNRSWRESPPGHRTPLQEAIHRARQARRFQGWKAGALARRNVFKADAYARMHRMKTPRGKSESGLYREEMSREKRFREAQR